MTGTLGSQSLSNSLSLSIQLSTDCLQSYEQVSITAPTIANKDYTLTSTDSTITYGAFSHSAASTNCDLSYTFQATPTANFITLDSSTRTISFYTSSNTDVGTYTITVTGQVTNLEGTFYGSTSFTLVVTAGTCQTSTSPIVIGGSMSDQTYTIGVSGIIVLTWIFTTNSAICDPSYIVYSITFSSPLCALSAAQDTIECFSSNAIDVGSHLVTVTGTITNGIGTYTSDVTSTVTAILPSCADMSETVTVVASPIQQVFIYNAMVDASSIIFDPFVEDSIYCDSSDIVYTITTNPTAPFITIDSATRTISFETTNGFAATYNV